MRVGEEMRFAATLLVLALAGCASAFRAPTTPHHRRTASPRALVSASAEGLQPGDRVAVIGASGNVGKLVALRLAESFEVVGVARDPSRVRGFLPEDKVKLVTAELTDPASLEKALEGAAACVICTGTTAFPTQAWSKKSSTEGIGSVVLKKLIDDDTPMTMTNKMKDVELVWTLGAMLAKSAELANGGGGGGGGGGWMRSLLLFLVGAACCWYYFVGRHPAKPLKFYRDDRA